MLKQKISIGIICFNEEDGIGKLLESLQEQTLLKCSYDLEVVVVSNGSSDQTVPNAREKLKVFDELGIKNKVVNLEIADKCAAWNHFIHQASDRADYYILLDGDVVLIEQSGLEELINTLETHPECRLCGGKIISKKGDVIERFDGKCYAGRGDILRNIVIPTGIIMDDAYISVTAVTNWYETDFEEGRKKGYLCLSESMIVSCGATKRDRLNISYWLASRKRTIMGIYTQKHVDFCMREIFGGGELAKIISMKLFYSNPHWFNKYLSKDVFLPEFVPPGFKSSSLIKNILHNLVYGYCYLLSLKGIRDKEFGRLAWSLKHRYW